MAEEQKTLDILHNGVKIGVAPDSVPLCFDDDKACADFLNELKNLVDLPTKYKKTINSCLTVLSSDADDEVNFGPLQILQMSELAFRYPANGAKIMAVVQYLQDCLVFDGTVPDGIFADLGSSYGLLGSLLNKPVADDDENADLDDDEEFGYNLDGGDSEEDEED